MSSLALSFLFPQMTFACLLPIQRGALNYLKLIERIEHELPSTRVFYKPSFEEVLASLETHPLFPIYALEWIERGREYSHEPSEIWRQVHRLKREEEKTLYWMVTHLEEIKKNRCKKEDPKDRCTNCGDLPVSHAIPLCTGAALCCCVSANIFQYAIPAALQGINTGPELCYASSQCILGTSISTKIACNTKFTDINLAKAQKALIEYNSYSSFLNRLESDSVALTEISIPGWWEIFHFLLNTNGPMRETESLAEMSSGDLELPLLRSMAPFEIEAPRVGYPKD